VSEEGCQIAYAFSQQRSSWRLQQVRSGDHAAPPAPSFLQRCAFFRVCEWLSRSITCAPHAFDNPTHDSCFKLLVRRHLPCRHNLRQRIRAVLLPFSNSGLLPPKPSVRHQLVSGGVLIGAVSDVSGSHHV